MTPQKIKKIRTEAGLTQSELAGYLGLGKHGDRTVRRWESGSVPIAGPVEKLLLTLEYIIKGE